MRKIRIFDTTLRDGEQSPGASMNVDEKIQVAKQLANLKVDIIEAGFAISSPGDFEAIKRIGGEIEGPGRLQPCEGQRGRHQEGLGSAEGRPEKADPHLSFHL